MGRVQRFAGAICALASVLAHLVIVTGLHAEAARKIEIVPSTLHADQVMFLQLSADERLVATYGQDESIKIWDFATGRLIRTLDLKALKLEAHGFTPDLRQMVVAHEDGSLALWDLEKGEPVRTLATGVTDVATVTVLADLGEVITAHQNGPLKVWDFASGKLKRTLGEPVKWGTILLLGDGSIVVHQDEHVAKQWNLQSGVLIRTFLGGDALLYDLALTPDRRRLVARVGETLKIWDLGSGRLARTIANVGYGTGGLRVDPLGKLVYSHSDQIGGENDEGGIEVRELASGKLVRKLPVGTGRGDVFALTRDGRQLIHGARTATITVWDTATARPLRNFGYSSVTAYHAAMAPNGHELILGLSNGLHQLWNLETGELVRTLESSGAEGDANTLAVVTGDGRRLVATTSSGQLRIWDLVSGQLVHKPAATEDQGSQAFPTALATSSDGKLAVAAVPLDWSGTGRSRLDQWDLRTGQLLRKLEVEGSVNALAISADGNYLASAAKDKKLRLWALPDTKLLNTYDGVDCASTCAVSIVGDVINVVGSTSAVALRLPNLERVREFALPQLSLPTIAFTPDGKWAARSGYYAQWKLELWNLQSGALVRTFEGLPQSHRAFVGNVAISPDAGRIILPTPTGVHVWDAQSGRELATIFSDEPDSWTTITPSGIFVGSDKGADRLSVVRGFEVYSVQQFFEQLGRGDLVAAALKGDREGKYKDAVFHLNLERVLNSGPAPQIELLEKKTEQAGGTVRLVVRVKGTGGGIGAKLIWRINGVTQGELTPPELQNLAGDPLGTALVAETLTVDPGKANTVEITAYNGAGLLATLPLRVTIDKFGVTVSARPRMHVLAIGVDKYTMPEYRLSYAAKDAREFAAAMKAVGSTLFADVDIADPLIDENVTPQKIEAAFDRIAAVAKPDDVFVLFLGGHGKSVEGRYYYYPQNLNFAAGQTYENAIGQDQWQQWLAKIPAQKTLLVLDTCESGAAGGLLRGGGSVQETAMEQLQHATGHNLIAAAGSTQSAIEGYKGHGVLTYALLDALTRKEGQPGDDKVKVGALADYVDEEVPDITQRVWGVYQRPVRKLSGNDFPIGLRVPALLTATEDDIPGDPTHVLIRAELVRKKPAADAESELEKLDPGSGVRVVKFVDGGFALVARGGKKLGYVPVEALAPIH